MPYAAARSDQSGTVLSMTPTSAQALQLPRASGFMSIAGSISQASSSGMLNGTVAQKRHTGFCPDDTLCHGSKVLSSSNELNRN